MVDTITNKQLLSLISQNIERPFFFDYLEDLESLCVFFPFSSNTFLCNKQKHSINIFLKPGTYLLHASHCQYTDVKAQLKVEGAQGMLAGLPQDENYFPKSYLNISHLSSSIYSKMPSWLILIKAIPSRNMFKRSLSLEIHHAMEGKHEYWNERNLDSNPISAT